jgi:hypothetical protein
MLYSIKGVYLALFGVPFIYMLCYINIFLTINFIFSRDFFVNRFYFWNTNNDRKNIITLFFSTLLLVSIGSILFPLNDSKELGNQFIWGCYIDYALGGVVFIWGIGLIFSVILILIGLINPKKIWFESRKKIFISLFIINLLTFLLIYILSTSIKLLSSNLHGASWSC